MSHRHINDMKRKNVGKENEKLLFHGTKSKQIDAICQQNIDWRICEVHETAYGKGEFKDLVTPNKTSHAYIYSIMYTLCCYR